MRTAGRKKRERGRE